MAEWIDRFLADDISRVLGKDGRILDLPAGTGNLSRRLGKAGYDVAPADLFPEELRWEGHEAVAADMNRPLPFEDGSFDAVVSQEGIEHLENLALFFRECRRVLREGGVLWITTPNYMDLSGRLSYFLTGMKSFHAGFPNEETTLWGRDGDRFYHGHAFSVPFFQIRYLLRVAGFDEVWLKGLGTSPSSTILYPFVWPFSRFLVHRAYRILKRKDRRRPRGRKRSTSLELHQDLERHAHTRELLCSRGICVRARLP